ncbi:MAG: hypothetical protein UW66_C0041G0003 [Candidatus Moranbacteria bacterium GW2011_GWF1_44_4]|nr:MAG: hypothetical protein UW66_C0041G0003 [Candidatus Moranbacteria bacterium GW2011_GWF1_44_4]
MILTIYTIIFHFEIYILHFYHGKLTFQKFNQKPSGLDGIFHKF